MPHAPRVASLMLAALLFVLPPAILADGPGDPIPDDQAEQAALALLKRFALPPAPDAAAEWTMLMCCPALGQRLMALEADLGNKSATAMQQVVDRKTMKGENRRALMFTNRMPQFRPEHLLHSKAFQGLCAVFARGKARAATAEERDLFYGEIPFEIAGMPVTVIDARGETLLIHEDKSQTGSLYIDLLSDLAASFGRPLPVPPPDLTTPEGTFDALVTALTRKDSAALSACAAPEVCKQVEKDKDSMAAAWRGVAEGAWKTDKAAASVKVVCGKDKYTVSLQKKGEAWSVTKLVKDKK